MISDISTERGTNYLILSFDQSSRCLNRQNNSSTDILPPQVSIILVCISYGICNYLADRFTDPVGTEYVYLTRFNLVVSVVNNKTYVNNTVKVYSFKIT